MPNATHAAAFEPVAYLLDIDVVGAVVGGVITGIVAIAVFLFSKRHTERGLRRDFARILLTEIGTIMLQVRPKIFGASTSDLYYVGAYDGLHKSGNIRYIPSGIHLELARLYGQYERGGPWAVDMGAAVDICARLEGAMRDNSGYREKIRRLGTKTRHADAYY